jgi:AcrR family transcriptional regulator
VTTTVRPARRTRPANRRALIIGAATELFRASGYEHVGMSDIAAAVNVAPSALYRHFPGKPDLLAEAVQAGLTPVRDLLAGLDFSAPEPALAALARHGVGNRHLGVLWQRETRHLPADKQETLRAEVRGITSRLAAHVATVRPDLSAPQRDLVAGALLSVMISPSFHQIEIPGGEFEAMLGGLGSRVLAAELTPLGPPVPEPAGLPPRSRREAVLAEAVRLFASRGYASVGIEDIAGELGIAGPSIYNHFPSKVDMLTTALTRGAACLSVQVTECLAEADSPAGGLRALVSGYARFTFRHPYLVDLLVCETRNLPEADQRAAVLAQREYVAEWVHLLCQTRPELDRAAARIQVQAAITLVNDAARTRHVRTASGALANVIVLTESALAIHVAGTAER